MSIEDVVLVSTVREDIRSHALQVDLGEIPLRVETEQLGALGLEIPVHLHFPKREAWSSVALKRVSAHDHDDELSVSPIAVHFGESADGGIDERLQADEDAPRNMSVLKGEPTRLMKNSRGAVAATRIVKTGKEALRIKNMGTQHDPKEDDNGVAIGMSTPNSRPPATAANEKLAGVPPGTSRPESPATPPSYPVGRGISLPGPFGGLLPKCSWSSCSCNALIVWRSSIDTKQNGVVCLDHGLRKGSATRDLVLNPYYFRYEFISPEHQVAIQAFLALDVAVGKDKLQRK